ncbi:MAG: hypothetical protein HY303_19035 [Candidatus Wallbacteria bacterium]|nr:hypothetical protein [Candidatus Wallbacteria bacterium]
MLTGKAREAARQLVAMVRARGESWRWGRLSAWRSVTSRRGTPGLLAAAAVVAVASIGALRGGPGSQDSSQTRIDVPSLALNASQPLRTASFEYVLERNPLGIDIQKPPPAAPLPPALPLAAQPAPPPPPPGPRRASGLKLLGTMVAGKFSTAIIQEPGGRQESYRIGESLTGRTVAVIERKRVTLRTGGREEYLDLPDDTAGPSPDVSPPPAFDSGPPPVVYAEPPPAAAPMSASPGQFVTRDVPRADLVRQFGNPANFLSQVIAEPYYENSKFAGYYVQEIKEGSYAASLGVQAGDILETVNGDLIDNVQKAFRLLGTIQRAPEMQVAVRRGSERMTMTYRLN